MSTAEISRACNGYRLPPIGSLRALLRASAATPEEIEYWELRWVVAYQHLEASGSRLLVRRPGEAEQVRAIAEQHPDRLQAIADGVLEQQDITRKRARLAAEKELAKLDHSIPNARPKIGYGPAACWVDLTDYLRRLLLLFTDPRKRKNPDGATMQEILAGLARLPDLTGVTGWQQLADDIATAYDKAQRDGWEVTLTGADTLSMAEAYFDRYADFRAEAGQRAAQLARQSVFLAAKPVVFPPTAIDLDRYDPPRSHYRHAVPVSAACASALAVPWLFTDAPVPWLGVGTYPIIVFLGLLVTIRRARAQARPD
ncbi:hypothetical protein [Streptomyces sp. A1136]|uniref:hypothetical protein n=1 Tax=Streptomyces sp. A1136 TaxID=2563102 RepID=UPI00109E6D4C|nr:hypothetical protein [Streptomyces sp. A1136]THA45159.1 hypothetical protein E6R62_35980 [Streptomyces sp. A1136]